MAECRTCGEKAGALRSECDSCKNLRVIEESRIAAELEASRSADDRERARVKEEQRQERYVAYLHDQFEFMHALVNAGRTPYLHRQVHSSVDAYVDNHAISQSPDFSDVELMGWNGWELVGTVPQTAGLGLSNSHQEGFGTNQTWGGGIGGLVTGCYYLFRLPVDSYVLEHQRELVIECFADQFPG